MPHPLTIGAAEHAKFQKDRDRRRNEATVRVSRIANGYIVTDQGTGETYSFLNLTDNINDHLEPEARTVFEFLASFFARCEK